MSSSYQRPGIRRTDARPSVPKRQQVRIANSSSAAVGDTKARVLDRSSPEIAGRNAGRDAVEFASFLKEIATPAAAIAESMDIDRASRQIKEFVDSNPDLPQIFRNSPEEAQDKIRALSGRAQDRYYSDLAEGYANEFRLSFPTAVQSDALLNQETTDQNREAQSRRYGELRSEYMAGLTALPPGYMQGVSNTLMQVEGAVNAELDKSRNAAGRERQAAAGAQDISYLLATGAAESIGVDDQLGDQISGIQSQAELANVALRQRVLDNENGVFTRQRTR